MNKEEFGELISRTRKEQKLTQKALAKKLHISDKVISRWENNINVPDIDMMQSISTVLGIPFDTLLQYKITDENVVEKIKREYENKTRKLKHTYMKIIGVILIISLFLCLLLFFKETYGKFKVYDVAISGENYYMTRGVYIDTEIQDIIYLGRINLIKEIKDKEVRAEIIIKDEEEITILQNIELEEDIEFELEKAEVKVEDLEDYFDKLYIRVIVENEGSSEEYLGKIEFTLRFANNKLIYIKNDYKSYKNNASLLTNEDIYAKLKELKFTKTKDGKYKDKTGNFIYDVKAKQLEYFKEDTKSNISRKYKYYIESRKLETLIYTISNDSNMNVIERYTYYLEKDRIECEVGMCIDYEKVLEMMEKYIKELE